MATRNRTDGRRHLSLVDPAGAGDAEDEVLARAIADMQAWIDRLPAESDWKWSFTRARRHVLESLADLRDRRED
jgi:hypothetical protein